MKLVNENFPERRELVDFAFKVCCRALRIHNEDYTVHVRVSPAASKYMDGGGAQTWNFISPKKEMLIDISDDLIRNDSKIILVLCHEMIHIKQLIRDGLRGHIDGIQFKGKLYPSANLAFARSFDESLSDMPWEKEAYGNDWKLFNKVAEMWFKGQPENRVPYMKGPHNGCDRY